MRKSKLEQLRESKQKVYQPIELSNLDDFLRLLLAGDRPAETRHINPTQRDFIYDATRMKAYMGPAGCAKTSTGAAAGLMRSLFQPGSKGLVARYDYNDLMDTTAQRLEEMVKRLPKGVLLDRDKSPPMRWWLQPVIDGEPSQITFTGLKEYLGSHEYHWALIDEADEVDDKVALGVNTRLRAYDPSESYTLMLLFNPPAKTHWLYQACTGKDPQGRAVKDPIFKLFVPEPRENILNLPRDYYDILAKDLPEDMRQRLVEGQWGSTFEGQPVYREFRYAVHVKDRLPFDIYSPLLRFWDFGYQGPACLWAQLDAEGRLLILREEIGRNVEAEPFAERCKAITATEFQNARDVYDYGDPAARQKKDTGSTLGALLKVGITLRYILVGLDPSIRAVRRILEQMRGGEAAFQISRRCTVTIDALKGGYHLDDHGKPFKDGVYDHPADALRYGIVNLFGPVADRPMTSAYGSLPTDMSYRASEDEGLRRSGQYFEGNNQ